MTAAQDKINSILMDIAKIEANSIPVPVATMLFSLGEEILRLEKRADEQRNMIISQMERCEELTRAQAERIHSADLKIERLKGTHGA